MKAPLLEEASRFKQHTAPNKEITGINTFKFIESEGETPEPSEMVIKTDSEISRNEQLQVQSDMESQMVLVTHGTQDNSSEEAGSIIHVKDYENKSNSTLEEAENEDDSDEEQKQ